MSADCVASYISPKQSDITLLASRDDMAIIAHLSSKAGISSDTSSGVKRRILRTIRAVRRRTLRVTGDSGVSLHPLLLLPRGTFPAGGRWVRWGARACICCKISGYRGIISINNNNITLIVLVKIRGP